MNTPKKTEKDGPEPGPWHTDGDSVWGATAGSHMVALATLELDEIVAMCAGAGVPAFDDDRARRRANAYLIAAAPTMRDALEEAETWLNEQRAMAGPLRAAIRTALELATPPETRAGSADLGSEESPGE
jgi:hypothetical protein